MKNPLYHTLESINTKFGRIISIVAVAALVYLLFFENRKKVLW